MSYASKLVEHAGRLSCLLTFHLELEQALTKAILAVAPDHKIDEFDFVEKLRIAASLALVPKKMLRAIKYANTLRNKAVYLKDFEITQEHLNTLISQLPQKQQSGIKEYRIKTKEERGFDDNDARLFELCLIYTLDATAGYVSNILLRKVNRRGMRRDLTGAVGQWEKS